MRTVLVTGGSSGIGAAACRLAARRSWAVYVGYRQGRERARAVVDEIKKAGGAAWDVHLPLEDPAKLAQALGFVAASSARVDALLLCASPPLTLASFLKTDENDLQEQLRVNVIGNQRLIALTWRTFFSKQKAGHVVAVSSQAAVDLPQPHMTAYLIAKKALAALLECALRELGPAGLRVSVVSPGYTETPMLQALHPRIVEAARATQIDSRFLSADQVAEKIVRCLDRPPLTPDIALHSISNRRRDA